MSIELELRERSAMSNIDGAPTRPVVWSIAGSDSGAGAGVQADLRAFDTFDVHGCTAVAAITAQNSVAVKRIDAVPVDQLDAQLAALAADMPPRAIKVGMLASAANVRCVARWVDRLREAGPVALVIDPIWRASTGAELGDAGMCAELLAELVPRATAITPNRADAAWLLGCDALVSDVDIVNAAAALRARGAQAVVITGGDADGGIARDWIDTPQARGWLGLPRVDTRHDHGTGCVYAASMAAAFALDFCAADAAVIAKMSTTAALEAGRPAGQGRGAVRPQPGFGLRSELLPTFIAAQDTASAALADSAPPFPALSHANLGLYAVVDSAGWVERVLAAGVRTVQLRAKEGAPAYLSEQVRRCVQAARAVDAQLFINDHWQLAIEHGAYGVHLGQEDLATADLGAIRRAGLRLGVSTHTYWEVCRAHALAPSYIACGPIYPTTTKDMPWIPQGPGNVAYWARLLREPVVVIGGMDAERAADATRCGAAGVAILRGIVTASDPEAAIAALLVAVDPHGDTHRTQAPALARSTLAWHDAST
jgi:hydroxymethylpyrimidine kinase/phosphomethylpyrimidine kinase/thiamine-phosphate diphosphorylase